MSSGASDRGSDRLDRLADDLPTSEADVAALRSLRRRRVEGALCHPNRLNPPALGWPQPATRRTFEGCAELTL